MIACSTALVALCLALAPQEPAPRVSYRAWLESPGGALPFGLELPGGGGSGAAATAIVVNGHERIPVPDVRWDGERLHMTIPPYDSWIDAEVDADRQLVGTWTKRRGVNHTTTMVFRARPGSGRRFGLDARKQAGPTLAIGGRWRVRFEQDEHPAVGIFAVEGDGTATGTFLTTLGDYRYLAGDYTGSTLRLSCFDGAHAFLFVARAGADGTLRGDFWSSDTWHEEWSATRDPDAELPDAFALTSHAKGAEGAEGTEGVAAADLTFPNLDGKPQQLLTAGAGATILYVFGTWCPNCGDAGRTIRELHRRYKGHGLAVVGLAFEHQATARERADRVRAYRNQHRVEFPILLAGLADKAAASAALPLLDRVRAYPTTIFLDAAGAVRAVHTGFSGPATGKAHQALCQRFEQIVEGLLAEAGHNQDPARRR